MQKHVRKIVIPVAGFGTRFLPATKASPKEMLPLVDKPVVQYIVEEAKASGIEEVIFVTSANKRAIEDHFDRNLDLEAILKRKGKDHQLEEVREISKGINFVYIRQGEPLGLGHAVLQAKSVIGDEPFIVCGGDDVVVGKTPAMKQIIDVYQKYTDPVLAVFNVKREETGSYGVVDPKAKIEDGLTEIKGIVEKPDPEEAPSTLISAARWLLTPDIFEMLEKTKPGKGGEIQLPDGIAKILKKRPIYAKTIDGTYFDCGNKLEYLKGVVHFAMEHNDIKIDFVKYLKNKI